MAEFSEKYSKIIKDIEKSISDEKEREIVLKKVSELSFMYMDVIDRISNVNSERMDDIEKHQDKLDEKFVHNYPSLEILNQILVKDTFYQNFDNCEFEIPKTYIYSCNANQTIDEEKVEKLMYPLIVKPGNNIEYHNHKFDGMFKNCRALTSVKIGRAHV